ncbi:MAG TPA: hypothetical protein VF101_16950 [Gaiellaceae bacterium]
MEPRFSLTSYAAILAGGLVMTSIFGHAVIATIFSAALLLYGAAMHIFVYAVRRRRARRRHRATDDRRVATQWAVASVIGLASAAIVQWLTGAVDWQRVVFGTIAIGIVVFALGLFVSALIDWYYVHPRLAGLTGPAPCETVGNGQRVGLTKIWYFHRLAATVIVSGAILGVPSTIGTLVNSDAAKTACFFATLALTAVVLVTNKDYASGVRFFKNPRVSVGDVVLLIREGWGGDPQRVYVLDVAVEGAKVKLLNGDDPVHVRPVDAPTPNIDDETGVDPGPLRFLQKADATMENAEIARCVHDAKDRPICRDGHCSGVNWYCRANPLSAAREEGYPDVCA